MINQDYQYYLNQLKINFEKLKNKYGDLTDEKEREWDRIKEDYQLGGTLLDKTLKDVIQLYIKDNSSLTKIGRTQVYGHNLTPQITSNELFAQRRREEGKDNQVFGIEAEKLTTQAMEASRDKIGVVIAEHVAIKKIRNEDALVVSGDVDASLCTLLQKAVEQHVKERSQERKSIKGWRDVNVAVIATTPQRDNDYGTDHYFNIELVFNDLTGGGQFSIDLLKEFIQVEEKNVQQEKLEQYMFIQTPTGARWKYSQCPYFIYKGRVCSVREMLDIVYEGMKNYTTFLKYMKKKGNF